MKEIERERERVTESDRCVRPIPLSLLPIFGGKEPGPDEFGNTKKLGVGCRVEGVGCRVEGGG